MRIDLKKLKSVDRGVVLAVIVTVVMLAGASMLWSNLNKRREEIDRLKVDVESKETQTAAIHLPTIEETQAWAAQEVRVRDVLLTDDVVPLVYEEISKIANETHLQRVSIDTQEKPVTPDAAADAGLRSVGVQRYLAITVKFRAEYRDAAAFIANVARLPRSLAIHSVDIRRDPPLVYGTVVIYLYKRGAA